MSPELKPPMGVRNQILQGATTRRLRLQGASGIGSLNAELMDHRCVGRGHLRHQLPNLRIQPLADETTPYCRCPSCADRSRYHREKRNRLRDVKPNYRGVEHNPHGEVRMNRGVDGDRGERELRRA